VGSTGRQVGNRYVRLRWSATLACSDPVAQGSAQLAYRTRGAVLRRCPRIDNATDWMDVLCEALHSNRPRFELQSALCHSIRGPSSRHPRTTPSRWCWRHWRSNVWSRRAGRAWPWRARTRSSLRLQPPSASSATTGLASVQRAADPRVFIRSPTTLRLETPHVALAKASSSTKVRTSEPVPTPRTAATGVRWHTQRPGSSDLLGR
jgi:hypothetical protein